jgi:hypothetical protein
MKTLIPAVLHFAIASAASSLEIVLIKFDQLEVFKKRWQ